MLSAQPRWVLHALTTLSLFFPSYTDSSSPPSLSLSPSHSLCLVCRHTNIIHSTCFLSLSFSFSSLFLMAPAQSVLLLGNTTPLRLQSPTNLHTLQQSLLVRSTLTLCLCVGGYIIAFKNVCPRAVFTGVYCCEHTWVWMCVEADAIRSDMCGVTGSGAWCQGKSWVYLENSVRWSPLSHADGTTKDEESF